VPLDQAARRGGADRHPCGGRGAPLACSLDTATRAPRPRLDLRILSSRARLSAYARPLPTWTSPARPPRDPPPSARGRDPRVRVDALRRGRTGRPRSRELGMNSGEGSTELPKSGAPTPPARERGLDELDGRIGEGWGGLSPN